MLFSHRVAGLSLFDSRVVEVSTRVDRGPIISDVSPSWRSRKRYEEDGEVVPFTLHRALGGDSADCVGVGEFDVGRLDIPVSLAFVDNDRKLAPSRRCYQGGTSSWRSNFYEVPRVHTQPERVSITTTNCCPLCNKTKCRQPFSWGVSVKVNEDALYSCSPVVQFAPVAAYMALRRLNRPGAGKRRCRPE